MSKTFVFNLPDIVCIACVQPIKNKLAKYKQIKIDRVVEDVVEKNITILVADDETQTESEIKNKLLKLITGLGITAEFAPNKINPQVQADLNGITSEITPIVSNPAIEVPTSSETDKTNLSNEPTPINSIPAEFVADETSTQEQADLNGLNSEITTTVIETAAQATTLPVTDKNNLSTKPKPRNTVKKYLIKGLIGVLSGFGMMALMMSGVMLPAWLMYLLMGTSIATTLYLGAESYKEAFIMLTRAKSLSMDSLFSISSLSIIGVTLASLFIPNLPMMLDAGLMIFGFRLLGRAIDESINKSVVTSLKFRNRIPATVEKLNAQDENETVPIGDIKKDDIILIRKGQVVPCDGYCLNPEASISDTIISGSHLPRPVAYEELLLAGMVVPDNVEYIKVRVKEKEAESFLARLDDKIAKANLEKAPIEDSANRILQYFIPGVLGISVLSGIIVGSLFNPLLAIQCAASVLASFCPCTLGFITPLSIKIGLAKASEHGIHFKSGEALQNAQQIDTVVFDLNGTLTLGTPKVSNYKINIQQGTSPQEFFQYLALLEQQSGHPFASSILEFINQKNIPPRSDLAISDVHVYHTGVNARINNDNLIVGNAEIMKQNSISLEPYQSVKENGHIIYLAKNGVVLGYLVLQDPLRTGAKETIDELKRLGKTVHICTGADQATANYYAELLNIKQEHIYANCTGSDVDPNARSKIQYIKQLQQQGKKVAMVGDAGNDTYAFSTANFSIAMTSNASDVMTLDKAGAVIATPGLYPVVNAFKIAQQTVSNIKQNLIMSLTYNTALLLVAGGLFVALGFVLNPGIGAALMVLQTSLVLLNQYWFRRKNITTAEPPPPAVEPQVGSTYKQFSQSNLLSAEKNTMTPNPEPTLTKDVPEIIPSTPAPSFSPAAEVATALRV